jgi:hypothetical protein
LLFFLIASEPAWAEDRKGMTRDGVGVIETRGRWALVIGVDDYEDMALAM